MCASACSKVDMHRVVELMGDLLPLYFSLHLSEILGEKVSVQCSWVLNSSLFTQVPCNRDLDSDVRVRDLSGKGT